MLSRLSMPYTWTEGLLEQQAGSVVCPKYAWVFMAPYPQSWLWQNTKLCYSFRWEALCSLHICHEWDATLAVSTPNCKAKSSSWCLPPLIWMTYCITVLIMLLKTAFSGKHTDGLVSVQWTSLNMRSIKLFTSRSENQTKETPSLFLSSEYTNVGDLPLPLKLKFYQKCISLIASSNNLILLLYLHLLL